MTTNHYVLSIDPQSQYEWEQCTLRHPLTGEQPDLTAEIARAIGDRAGVYLVAVKVEVEVLDERPIAVPEVAEFERARVTVVKSPKLPLAS